MALALLLAATAVSADGTPRNAGGTGISAHLQAWEPRPFGDVVLDNPDLAACFLLAQGWWSSAAAPQATLDSAALERAIGEQLAGGGQPSPLSALNVYVAVSERNATMAMAHGDTVLVMAPKGGAATVAEMASAIAAARLLASFKPAPPDPRCSEPLLALGEAIARAGALTLAELPPALRPVRAWVDELEVVPGLATLANEALDDHVPWAQRKARLAPLGQLGGAGPRVANAAALVVETFGDSPRALRAPLDLLLAWQAQAHKAFPPLPYPLRRALGKPLDAGLPKEKRKVERAAVAADALVRRVASGTAQLGDVGKDAPQALRLELAANARAKGEPALCSWLTAGTLKALRTGCRSDGEAAGIVFARPRPDAGFDVVWQSPSGDEAPLLSWPRWVLFPAVNPARGELCFIDPDGLWVLPLDAHAAPRLVIPGVFRQLAVSPDGAAIAVARWPDGQVFIVRDTGTVEAAINGKGGLVWLESDLLLAADGDKLSLASLRGEVRAGVLPFPCSNSLAMGNAGVTAALGRPCEPSLVRVVLPERHVSPLVKLSEPPVGVALFPEGDIAFGSAEGLWRWRGQGNPERIGSGLTPGPG